MTTISFDSSIDELDLPPRIYNAFRRNDVDLVGDVLLLSDHDVLRMRNLGPGSLHELEATLERLGLVRQPEDPGEDRLRPLRTPPEGLERARWIGRQLDALAEDDRAYPATTLGTRYKGDVSQVEQRRYAWRMYRWAAGLDEKYPDMTKGSWNAHPLPGSVELHLEGLNRLAHDELD